MDIGWKSKVADVVAAMKEVESANVLVTNANAYVAVELKEGNKGDEQLENKIAEHVQNFRKLYVEYFPMLINHPLSIDNHYKKTTTILE